MEIVPDTERHRNTVESALNNFEALGVDVERPERVVYGFTPRARASYDPTVDTVFIGAEAVARDKLYELATFEHEAIHYEQYRRFLDEPSEELQSLAREVEDNALSTARENFDENQLVDALTDDQHLNYYSFRSMMGLAINHDEFIDEAYSINDKLSGRLENFPEETDEAISDEIVEEAHYAEVSGRIERLAEDYWDEILESEEAEKFRPLIERYNIDIEDDVLEAQAQFWELFRLGALEDLPKDRGVYPDSLDERLEGLDLYASNRFYDNGENVKDATKDILEDFRERKHTENRDDHEIAVEMLNKGLEKWNSPKPEV